MAVRKLVAEDDGPRTSLQVEFPAIVLMGVSGSGKSTIGTLLANRLRTDFIDADHLHPASNIEKMAAGAPLNDTDRLPWLELVGSAIAAAARPPVVACSALKRIYRDALRGFAPTAFFVHLLGSDTLLAERLATRSPHFMPGSLLGSQLTTLEPLGRDESAMTVDVSAPIDMVLDQIVDGLRRSGQES